MSDDVDVVEALRAAISRGDYAPRQRLVESDLCEQYGASRFIVRMALQTLAAQGIVEMQRNRGARIRQVSIEEAIEIAEARRALESLIAGRAAERATKDDATELRGLIEQMKVASGSGELIAYSDLNAVLHKLVRRIAQHHTAAQVIEILGGQMVRHQFQLALVPGRIAVSLGQHERIAEAIAQRDPEAASQAMHDHVSSVIEALRSLPALGRA